MALTVWTLGSNRLRQLGRLTHAYVILGAHLERVLLTFNQAADLELTRPRAADVRVAVATRVTLLNDVLLDGTSAVSSGRVPRQDGAVLSDALHRQILRCTRSTRHDDLDIQHDFAMLVLQRQRVRARISDLDTGQAQ